MCEVYKVYKLFLDSFRFLETHLVDCELKSVFELKSSQAFTFGTEHAVFY